MQVWWVSLLIVCVMFAAENISVRTVYYELPHFSLCFVFPPSLVSSSCLPPFHLLFFSPLSLPLLSFLAEMDNNLLLYMFYPVCMHEGVK